MNKMIRTFSTVTLALAVLLSLSSVAHARPYVVTDWSNCLEMKQGTLDWCVFVQPGTYATGDDLCTAIKTALWAQFDGNAWCAYNPVSAPFGFSISWAHGPETPGFHGMLSHTGKDRRLGIWALLSFDESVDVVDGGTTGGLFGVSTLPVIPFGYVDAPAPNATVSGTITVSGWTLAQRPAAMTGPGITLYVDGVPRGTVTYGTARPDVQAAYPDYVNSAAAGWSISLDTRALTNGQHILYMLAYDDMGAGRGAGIGSRYLTVVN